MSDKHLLSLESVRLICILLLSMFWVLPVSGANELPDGGLDAARSAVGEFGSALKIALGKALANGNPVEALDVCAVEAPHIAGAVADRSGISIGRTSERLRNPANRPTDWQLAVIREWQADQARGIDLSDSEFFTLNPDGGFNYMKPIFIKPMCLVCHGEPLSAELQSALKARYPADRAIGYQVGELRGAFVAYK